MLLLGHRLRLAWAGSALLLDVPVYVGVGYRENTLDSLAVDDRDGILAERHVDAVFIGAAIEIVGDRLALGVGPGLDEAGAKSFDFLIAGPADPRLLAGRIVETIGIRVQGQQRRHDGRQQVPTIGQGIALVLPQQYQT